MSNFKYIGEDKFFVKNGDILTGHLTTWSIKKSCSSDRETVNVLYVDGAGFKGESLPINSKNLQEL